MNRTKKLIYLDHSATTPVRPEVVKAMQPFWMTQYGNPSSIHGAGRGANVALTKARQRIASIIGAKEKEIIFTGCGTEGNNAALRGIAHAQRAATGANRIVISAVEHHAVYHTAEDLASNFGFDLTILPVDGLGQVHIDEVESALGLNEEVALVSVMMANNEVGTLQPIGAVGELCKEYDVPFHTDAVQAAGKFPLHVDQLQVDALTISAHKIYGPKGCGFLYLRSGTPFQPILTGGSHENNRRAGTENVPLIVGMAEAFDLIEAEREVESQRLTVLCDRLIEGIQQTIPDVYQTGSPDNRLPNLASFIIQGVEAEGVLIGLDLAGIAASSGSACTSGAQRPSHVLEAMNVPTADAVGGLRLSLGKSTTDDDVDYLLATLPGIVQRIRSFAPAVA
ncbi:MAG: cysteine desulfurase family protein [Chloroflexota bacterium]